MESDQSQPLVFGLGNIFIDCYATVSKDMLEKYGLKYGFPAELTPEQLPVFEDLQAMDDYKEMPGGSTLNTVRAINYLMITHKNKKNTILLSGAVVKDKKGETIKQFLDSESIQHCFDEHEEGHTGQWAILVDVDGERTPVSNSGVNGDFRVSHISSNNDLKQSLESCKILYAEGFFVSSSYQTIKEVYTYANQNRKLFAFNLCGEYWVETYKDHFIEIIPYCDFLMGNTNEFTSLAGILNIEFKTHEELIEKLSKYEKHRESLEGAESALPNVRIVLMSWDKDGAILSEYNFDTQTHTQIFVPSELIEKEKVVDTCCAGDTFVGGYLFGYLTGETHEESIKYGHRTAGKVIQKMGCYFE